MRDRGKIDNGGIKIDKRELDSEIALKRQGDCLRADGIMAREIRKLETINKNTIHLMSSHLSSSPFQNAPDTSSTRQGLLSEDHRVPRDTPTLRSE